MVIALIQIGGGIAGILLVIGGTWLGWQKLRHRIDSDYAHYLNAAGHRLRSPKLDDRVGALLSLEQLILRSRRQTWPVLEQIASFVRTRSPKDLSQDVVGDDVQAGLNVLGRRGSSYRRRRGHRLDLCRTNLCGADLTRARFQWSNFSDSLLGSGNVLVRAACFRDAELRGAIFRGVTADWVNFWGAKLARADFSGATGRSTVFIGADLSNANLSDSSWHGAQFARADLTGAILHGTDLSTAEGLTVEQIATCHLDDGTKLPPHIGFAERNLYDLLKTRLQRGRSRVREILIEALWR